MPVQIKKNISATAEEKNSGKISVNVYPPSEDPFCKNFERDKCLPEIRKELAGKMDKLLFTKSKCKINLEDEEEYKLIDIVEKDDSDNTFHLHLYSEYVMVSVQSAFDEPFRERLKLDDTLSTIREILKEKVIKMDEQLFFHEGDFILLENEDKEKLRSLFKKERSEDTYNLCLKVKVWEYLNELYQLDHGCEITDNRILRANERAFTMTKCKINRFPSPRYNATNYNKMNDQTTENLLSGNANFYTSAKFEISGNRDKGTKANSSDEYIEYCKSYLEFGDCLEPREEFITELGEIENCEDFKKIIKNYGHYIPTRIFMGGKIYKEEVGTSKIVSKGGSAKVDILNNGIGYSSSRSEEVHSQCTKESYVGFGKSDDEESRNEALKNEKNWEPIGYKNKIDIFELLTKNQKHKKLREKILEVIGQRILYSNIETLEATFSGCKPIIGSFKEIKQDFTIRNDFYIFAIILDKKGEKNDYFNCQIWLNKGTPQYIIHCISPDPSSKKYSKLQIKYMIIGNYTDFKSINYDELKNSNIQLEVIKGYELLGAESDNFIGISVFESENLIKQHIPIIGHHFYTDQNHVRVFTFSYRYSLDKKQCIGLDKKEYDNLPNFRFYTLKISNLKRQQFKKYSEITHHPKYFSLCSSEKICGSIFLKYTHKEIKLKVGNCSKHCDIW
ncbi:unnamed protein product [Rhizophagus irregularis]|uniref:DUF7431 domain-containing protein n=1 Tax=Rhizophagus irregularis TaxID=588596 RepID=A0A2I1GZB0_9GLOM|nr:hypothetical protein RhiirA4_495356 [Rhizophagus irregularis]CAB4431138.1 unnamed protein product [Rhizophagus irregularis]